MQQTALKVHPSKEGTCSWLQQLALGLFALLHAVTCIDQQKNLFAGGDVGSALERNSALWASRLEEKGGVVQNRIGTEGKKERVAKRWL